MSTNATIGVKLGDGSIRSVYLHCDGHINRAGDTLNRYYPTVDHAMNIMSLGNMSSLDKSVEKPDGHSFENRVEGYSVFYGRDRGESNTEARNWKNVEEWMRSQICEYNYLFHGGVWYVSTDGENWFPVSSAKEIV